MPDPHRACYPLPQRLAEDLSASKSFCKPGQLVPLAVQPQGNKRVAEQSQLETLLMSQPEGTDLLGMATFFSHLQHVRGA